MKPVFDLGSVPGGGDRWERLFRRIMAAAATELERRGRIQSLVYVLSRWSRPVVSSAAVAVLIFGSALAIYRGNEGETEPVAAMLAQYLIFDEEQMPTLAEAVWALEGEER